MSDLITYLDKRLDRIEDKVDHLIKFKWQIIGGSAAVSFIVSVVLFALFGGR